MSRLTPRYSVRPWALACYFVLFVVMVVLALPYVTSPPVRLINPDVMIAGFSSHMSNLFLSFLPLFAYGFVRLLFGAGMRELVIVGLVLIVANLGYEVFLPLWNTRDVLDAAYGIVGVLLAWGFLFALQRWGLKPTAGSGSVTTTAAAAHPDTGRPTRVPSEPSATADDAAGPSRHS